MATAIFDLSNSKIEGVTLIEASAGTGKTYAIEGLFLRCLLEKKVKVENILVVTFTEAATAELRGRISDKIRQAVNAFQGNNCEDEFLGHLISKSSNPTQDENSLQLALAGFDEAAIYTIHGFCQKMLGEFAFESRGPFDAELLVNQQGLIEELAVDYWRNKLYGAGRDFAAMFLTVCATPLNLAGMLSQTLSRPVKHILPELAEIDPVQLFQEIAKLYQEMKKHWDGERENICAMLREYPHWHKKYRESLDDNLTGIACFFEENKPVVGCKSLLCFTREVISKKTKKGSAPPEDPFFASVDRYQKLIDRMPYAVQLDFLGYASRELLLRKQQRNLRSFDDLLYDLHKIATSRQGDALADKIRQKFEIALIDEFQDTDPIQYEIFKTLFTCSERQLFLIGDPKQSIYNFRGADIFTYLQAENDADIKYTLPVNYRSDRDLVEAVNSIFSFRGTLPFGIERILFQKSSGWIKKPQRSFMIDGNTPPPLTMWLRDSSGKDDKVGVARQQIAEATAAKITRLLTLGSADRAVLLQQDEQIPLQPKDIAVLVRTHNEARMIQAALERRRVPSVVTVRQSVFDCHEFRDICTIAAAVVDFRQERQVKRALVTDLMGVSGTMLHSLTSDAGNWDTIVNNFREYHTIWAENGFYRMMHTFLHQEEIRQKILKGINGERRLTNVLHVMELFHLAEVTFHYSMAGLVQWAGKARLHDADEQEEYQVRLETDADAVKILTVHASKGLEFPLVFIPFSWGTGGTPQCFFHDPQKDYELTWDLAKAESSKKQAARENLAENLRLFYVALTRAKNACWVAWGDIPRTDRSCYSYLFHGKEKDGRLADLKLLEASAEGTIRLSSMPDLYEEIFRPADDAPPKLHCRTFCGSIKQDWGISSFSALASRKRDVQEGLDHDQDQAPIVGVLEEEEAAAILRSIRSFPGGARTGECFHEMFEYLDVAEGARRNTAVLVQEKLEKYGFFRH